MSVSDDDATQVPADTGGDMVRDNTLGLLVVLVVLAIVLVVIGAAMLPYIDRVTHMFNAIGA